MHKNPVCCGMMTCQMQCLTPDAVLETSMFCLARTRAGTAQARADNCAGQLFNLTRQLGMLAVNWYITL